MKRSGPLARRTALASGPGPERRIPLARGTVPLRSRPVAVVAARSGLTAAGVEAVRVALLVRSAGRCEAHLHNGVGGWVRCGAAGVDGQHRITRARGGTLLDPTGLCLVNRTLLCRTHHRLTDDSPAGDRNPVRVSLPGYGLQPGLAAGSLRTGLAGTVCYVGPDPLYRRLLPGPHHSEQGAA